MNTKQTKYKLKKTQKLDLKNAPQQFNQSLLKVSK